METLLNVTISHYSCVINGLEDKTILEKIKKDLTVTQDPSSVFGNFKPKTFKIYKESKKVPKLYIPIYYFLETISNTHKTIVNFKFKDRITSNFLKGGVDSIELRPKQLECFEKCKEIKEQEYGGGIINCSTAFGKTVTALKIACYFGYKSIIVVNKIELIDQWKREIKKWYPNVRIGIIQGDKFDIENKDIILAMLQTVSLKGSLGVKDLSSFTVGFIDEIHNIGSEMFSQIMFKLRPRYLFGLTATLERKDKLEKIIKWYIGDILYSDTNLLGTKKQTTKIVLYNYKGSSSVEKFLYDKKTPSVSTMLSEISNDIQRNGMIIDILTELLETPSNCILVCSDRIAQLKYLFAILESTEITKGSSGLYIGSMKRDQLDTSKGKRIVLGTYQIVSEGFNLPKLNCLVFATPRSNIIQTIGRIYRQKHEIVPSIIDITDNFSIFKYQLNKRKKIYNELIESPEFSTHQHNYM